MQQESTEDLLGKSAIYYTSKYMFDNFKDPQSQLIDKNSISNLCKAILPQSPNLDLEIQKQHNYFFKNQQQQIDQFQFSQKLSKYKNNYAQKIFDSVQDHYQKILEHAITQNINLDLLYQKIDQNQFFHILYQIYNQITQDESNTIYLALTDYTQDSLEFQQTSVGLKNQQICQQIIQKNNQNQNNQIQNQDKNIKEEINYENNKNQDNDNNNNFNIKNLNINEDHLYECLTQIQDSLFQKQTNISKELEILNKKYSYSTSNTTVDIVFFKNLINQINQDIKMSIAQELFEKFDQNNQKKFEINIFENYLKSDQHIKNILIQNQNLNDKLQTQIEKNKDLQKKINVQDKNLNSLSQSIALIKVSNDNNLGVSSIQNDQNEQNNNNNLNPGNKFLDILRKSQLISQSEKENDFQQENQELKQKILQLEKEIHNLETQNKEIQDLNNNFKDSQIIIKSNDQDINNNNQNNEDLQNQLDQYEVVIQKLNTQNEGLEELIKKLNNQTQNLSSENNDLHIRIQQLQQENQDLKIKQQQQENQNIQNNQNTQNNDNQQETQKLLAVIKELEQKILTQNQDLQKSQKELSIQENKNAFLTSENEKCNYKIEQIQNQLKTLQQNNLESQNTLQIEEIHKEQQQILKQKQNENEDLKQQLQEKENNYQQIKNQFQSCEQEKNEVLNELSQIQQKYNEIMVNNENIGSQFNENKLLEQFYEQKNILENIIAENSRLVIQLYQSQQLQQQQNQDFLQIQ